MKKVMKGIILIATACMLTACNSDSDKIGSDFKMTATVIGMSDNLEVNVIDGEYGASGIYWVIIADATEIIDKNGDKLNKSSLTPGTRVEILYGGQVMMSYPPKIVAARIAVL